MATKLFALHGMEVTRLNGGSAGGVVSYQITVHGEYVVLTRAAFAALAAAMHSESDARRARPDRGGGGGGGRMTLPPVDDVAALVHQAWMDAKRAQGVESRKAEDGEELMRPYSELSPKARELDRATVWAVYDAIMRATAPRVGVGSEGVE